MLESQAKVARGYGIRVLGLKDGRSITDTQLAETTDAIILKKARWLALDLRISNHQIRDPAHRGYGPRESISHPSGVARPCYLPNHLATAELINPEMKWVKSIGYPNIESKR